MSDFSIYRERLHTELEQIRTELERLGIEQPLDHDWVTTPEDINTETADPNLAADANEEWLERRGVLAALETRFNNIRRALQKIEAGTYGVCEISGAAIESERLDANPAARTCIAHKDDESTLPL